MSGDRGCGVAIAGVKQALADDGSIAAVLLVGRETDVRQALAQNQLSDKRVEIVPASEVLTMEDKPLEGIRRKKDSSMVRAIELVRNGRADAVISAGNTGALVAASMKLGRLDGVERPAIACRMPSRTQDFILLDAGANAVCGPQHLGQFAVMGSLYATEILGLKNPRVGVLSNGSEESKGNDLTREAARLCSLLDLNFVGYVEGFDLFNDGVDVVVCDGFVGNIVLKTAESLGSNILRLLKQELTATPIRKLGAWIARDGFRGLRKRMNPEDYGGAIFIGVNGVVIKAHGSSSERAFASAVRVAAREIQHNLNQILITHITRANKKLAGEPPSSNDPQN
jgi:glycerol-3-phosphate acyltransferase PlsX